MLARLDRRKLWAIFALTVTLAALGRINLANNEVAVSYIDSSSHTVSIPTLLSTGNGKLNVAQFEGKEYYHFTTLKTQLSIQGQPLDGMTVVFKIGTIILCTSTTNGGGKATCNTKVAVADLPGPMPTHYTVWFAGNGAIQGSTADGLLEKVTGDGTPRANQPTESEQ